jgi:hypothetical protein
LALIPGAYLAVESPILPMGPSDIAGVFSRYFVVGFYVPAFATLVALSETLGNSRLPELYRQNGAHTQILIDGALAIPIALALSGLHQTILDWFRGAPLWRRRDRLFASRIYVWKTTRSLRRYRSLREADQDPSPSPKRTSAAWNLDRYYPGSEEQFFPTRFGNILRATEFHAYTRYGLDTVVAWPRIEMLLGQTEADIHQSARGDVAFFVNTCLGAGVLTVTALTCAVLDRSISLGLVSLVGAALVPFAYRAALESRFGGVMQYGRASICTDWISIARWVCESRPPLKRRRGSPVRLRAYSSTQSPWLIPYVFRSRVRSRRGTHRPTCRWRARRL